MELDDIKEKISEAKKEDQYDLNDDYETDDEVIEEYDEYVDEEEEIDNEKDNTFTNVVETSINSEKKPNKKKKIIVIVICIIILVGGVFFGIIFNSNTGNKNVIDNNNELKKLPKPQISGGARGELGIDKNINESTIDDYLGRSDSVYRDMRMLEDPANYEAIGGDRFLSGYIDGFEVVPLPYIIPVNGLPGEVGNTYTGDTLFRYENNTYIPNYKESMQIIEELFPKDKVIFLMCGGGGYAGMMKNFLISLGWNADKIYNIGGYWYYNGKNNVSVKKINNGVVSYDFDIVNYHEIKLDELTYVDNYNGPTVDVSEIKLNTSDVSIEEGSTFQLNAIVLPNEASDKEVVWASSDESIANVNSDGLIRGMMEGTVTISATSKDGKIRSLCKVAVKKKEVKNLIELDDITDDAINFASNSPAAVYTNFLNTVYNNNGGVNPKYFTKSSEGWYDPNELYDAEYAKYEENLKIAIINRKNILDKLIKNKKSFVIVFDNSGCGSDDFLVSYAAQKILNVRGIQYLFIYPESEDTFEKSSLYFDEFSSGSIVIVNKGKVYGFSDPDKYSFKDEDELVNWLSKYIKM